MRRSKVYSERRIETDKESKAIGLLCFVTSLLFLSLANVRIPAIMLEIYHSSMATFYSVAFAVTFGLIFGSWISIAWYRESRVLVMGRVDDGLDGFSSNVF